MQPLTFSPATIVILLLILAAAVWAVRRLTRKGLCDCHDKSGCSGCPHKGAATTDAQPNCAHCSAVDLMLKHINAAENRF